MSVRTFTIWDELRLWWELHGSLQHDVIQYYFVCAANGAWTGYLLGCQILGRPIW
jgi:hypothetical protein